MSTTWQTPISSFETNRRRVGALKSLGVVSVGDALTYYPFRVTDRFRHAPCAKRK